MSKILVIQHADILTPFERLEQAALVIEDGKIASVGKEDIQKKYPGAETLDASECIITPGWMDIQFNGGFGKDFTLEPESIWDVAAQLPRWGTTRFCPTIVTSPMETFDKAIAVWRQGPPSGWKGAIPLGLHFEGPFLDLKKKGAHNPVYLQSPDLELIKDWRLENGVRLVTLAPELPGALAMAQELIARGVTVSAGHSMATYEQAMAGFKTGITAGTHLYNAMPTIEHRAPGLAGAVLTNGEITAGVIADGIHSHPAMVDLAWRSKGNRRFVLVTDAMAALGMPSGNYILGDFEVVVDETSARLKGTNTLAGSILSQEKALKNLMAFTGCSLQQAIPTLTSTPAELLHLPDTGRIIPGSPADLTIITPDGSVMTTIIGGEIVYQH